MEIINRSIIINRADIESTIFFRRLKDFLSLNFKLEMKDLLEIIQRIGVHNKKYILEKNAIKQNSISFFIKDYENKGILFNIAFFNSNNIYNKPIMKVTNNEGITHIYSIHKIVDVE